jgi:hypothetical protein
MNAARTPWNEEAPLRSRASDPVASLLLLHPVHVRTGLGIHAHNGADVHEAGYADLRAACERGGFHHLIAGIAFHGVLGIGHFQFHRFRGTGEDGLVTFETDLYDHFFLHELEGISEEFHWDVLLLEAGLVHAHEVVPLAVEVLQFVDLHAQHFDHFATAEAVLVQLSVAQVAHLSLVEGAQVTRRPVLPFHHLADVAIETDVGADADV